MGFLQRLAERLERVFQSGDGFRAQPFGDLDIPRQLDEPRLAPKVLWFACAGCGREFSDFQALVWHATKGECAPPPVTKAKVN